MLAEVNVPNSAPFDCFIYAGNIDFRPKNSAGLKVASIHQVYHYLPLIFITFSDLIYCINSCLTISITGTALPLTMPQQAYLHTGEASHPLASSAPKPLGGESKMTASSMVFSKWSNFLYSTSHCCISHLPRG